MGHRYSGMIERLIVQQASNGIEQDIWRFAFGKKAIGKFKSRRLVSCRRDNENWHLRFQFLHLSCDFCSCLSAQKVVGDDQINRVVSEYLEPSLARQSCEDIVSRAGKQELADA